MSETHERNDLLWRHYELHIGLYKHYLELVIKFNVFHYAVTGGILSFYFAHQNDSAMRWSLLFPWLYLVTASGLAMLLWHAASGVTP